MSAWLGLVGPGAFAVIMGGTMLVTRMSEPYRKVPDCVAVASARQFRSAERYVARLIASGTDETVRIKFAITAMLAWLRSEAKHGPARRRLKRARQEEYWETRLEVVNSRMGLPPQV